MTSGLEWDNRGERSSNEMADSPNWLQYVLERPVTSQPGTVFNYSNGNAHLMSGVLQTALGVPISLYAKSKLFDPLGITNVSWELIRKDIQLVPGHCSLRLGIWPSLD